MPIIKHIVGDIRETNCDIIAHGVNCQSVMGSGVARALYEKWPEVKKAYHTYYSNKVAMLDLLPEDFLGKVGFVHIEGNSNPRLVANCFTQLDYGRKQDYRYLSYHALRRCLQNIKGFIYPAGYATQKPTTVAIPKIGCGLAGGDWNIVERIIDNELDNVDVYLYTLE